MIEHTQQLLRPVRLAAAAILPPELAIADMSMGRIAGKEKSAPKNKRRPWRDETLGQQIKKIQSDIDALAGSVAESTSGIHQGLGDRLSDGMNTYLNKLNIYSENAWVVGNVGFQLEERSFKIRVGKADWQDEAWRDAQHYFLLAYHYALLDLRRFPESNFPGLLLIDFPAELERNHGRRQG